MLYITSKYVEVFSQNESGVNVKISHSKSQRGQVHEGPPNAFSQWYRLKCWGGPSPRNTKEIEYTGVWRGPLFLAGPTTCPLHIYFGLNTLFRCKPTTPFIAIWPHSVRSPAR
ncbi:unnamed protein product [Pylaiella littoralis]